ncbi:hypothetical protein [Roseibium alexandrii]|uniref:Oxidoreductase molybdopterin-binding domain-containing protein n=1 Tax=Roseibium alexandrii TaxID=388408 RepID=A0A0M7ARF6_9HYPH|nr:hypothetical protein [Roseibium alexandrii]CTQ76164.1 hypothetical protein LAX5112_04492 [Roseibium alexandrii]
MKRALLFVSVFLGVPVYSPALADPIPVSLEPITHEEASIEVHASAGTIVSYTPAEIEQLPTYRVTTTTPWRSEPVDFDGVLLSDLLKKHSLNNAAELIVKAENDYSVEFLRKTWEAAPFLIATRVNGKPISRRERGPIQFIVAADDYDRETDISERHLVWMVSSIRLK